MTATPHPNTQMSNSMLGDLQHMMTFCCTRTIRGEVRRVLKKAFKIASVHGRAKNL